MPRRADSTEALAEPQPDVVVAALCRSLRVAQHRLNWLYELESWLFNRALRRSSKSEYFNYLYVAEWAVVLTAGLLLVGEVGGAWRLVFVGLALHRLAELAIWYSKLLVDRLHRLVISPERNLLFLFADALVAVTAVGVLHRFADPHLGASASWFEALAVFTLNGSQVSVSGVWDEVATALGTFTGVALLGAGLALVIGLIEEKFERGTGSYTGPLYRDSSDE
jgi:hypothetical protein